MYFIHLSGSKTSSAIIVVCKLTKCRVRLSEHSMQAWHLSSSFTGPETKSRVLPLILFFILYGRLKKLFLGSIKFLVPHEQRQLFLSHMYLPSQAHRLYLSWCQRALITKELQQLIGNFSFVLAIYKFILTHFFLLEVEKFRPSSCVDTYHITYNLHVLFF